MERDDLAQELRRRERQLAAIARMSARLYARTKLGDLDDLERQILQVAVETVDASAGTIYLHDPDQHCLVFKYVLGEKAAERRHRCGCGPATGSCSAPTASSRTATRPARRSATTAFCASLWRSDGSRARR